MESVFWNLRTLNGFSTLAPMLVVLFLTLTAFWDYPIMLVYALTFRALGMKRRFPAYAKPLPMLVVIPSLLRKEDELTSMLSTVQSVAQAREILTIEQLSVESDSVFLRALVRALQTLAERARG